jgi:hypothetical protein
VLCLIWHKRNWIWHKRN